MLFRYWDGSERPVGEIIVDIHLENLHDRGLFQGGHLPEDEIRSATVPAVADTGAVMLALPQEVVDQLGLQSVRTINTTFADGRRGELDVAGPLSVTIGDREMPTDCIVLPAGAEALVGQIVMERLDLIADSLNQRLTPRPESPDRPMLRV